MVSVAAKAKDYQVFQPSLNPYFCGRWFLCNAPVLSFNADGSIVLILISVEDGFCGGYF